MKNVDRKGVDRRGFLTLWGVGVAGVALPAWMAFELRTPGAKERLAAARARAKAAGRPLLVILFPEDEAERWTVGEAWGQLLHYGSDEVMSDLALCELACARLSDLRGLRPKLEGLPAWDSLALLLEPGASRVRVLQADLTPPDMTKIYEEGGLELYERQATERLEKMARALHATLAPDERVVARRLEQWGEAQGEQALLDALAVLDTGRPPGAGLAARYPTLTRALAEEAGDERDAWLEVLSRATREQLESSAPAGTRWGVNTGCGCEIEGEEGLGAVACGMGMVPEMGRRFLSYWVDSRS